MTFGEKLRELNSQGKTLQFVRIVPRGYEKSCKKIDVGDRLIFPTKFWCKGIHPIFYVVLPSESTQHNPTISYYRVVDLPKGVRS